MPPVGVVLVMEEGKREAAENTRIRLLILERRKLIKRLDEINEALLDVDIKMINATWTKPRP